MVVLAIFDITGIQNYIFNSNKLKENIGGSIIVKNTLEKYLIEALEKVSDKYKVTFKKDWTKAKDDKFKERFINKGKLIEVVYIGGGNAVVAFSDEEYYNATTKLFSLFLLEKTYSLNVASCFVEMTDDFKKDREDLYKKLVKVKRNMLRQSPMGNISITNHDLKTGLPLTHFGENNSYISTERYLKLKEKEREKEEEEDKDDDPYTKFNIKKPSLRNGYEIHNGTIIDSVNFEDKDLGIFFADRFDDLVGEKGKDSFMGVVHIDGNNMGKTIEELPKNEGNYNKAVETMGVYYGVKKRYK